MTAEGTACNGAGEAPKAEFAPEKEAVAAAAAPAEEKPAGEEDLGGPFVIVNGGDSDGHSDRGSDLGKAPDEDSAPSEEDDATGSNAVPDAAPVGGGDHGADAEGGEVGAPGAAALGASSVDGGDRASDGSEGGGEDEGKGEPSSDCVAEVPQQEDVGEEDGGAAALPSGGSELAIASSDSEAPAVDSEVEGKEGAVDEIAVADVAEAVVQHQEASTEQDGDAAVMSSGHDAALSSPKSSSAAIESEVITEDIKEQSTTDVVELQATAMESEVIREDSKEQSTTGVVEPQDTAMESEVIREDNKEQSTSDVVELQEQGTVEASASVENEHLCADMKADSLVAATEPDSQEDAAVESCRQDDALVCTESGSADIESEAEDSKQEQSNADVVEVEGQGVGRADALMANGHADTQADSSEAATEIENHAVEIKLTEVAESGEDAAASGEQDVTDASSQTNGHICVALSADSGVVSFESKARSFETNGQETDQQQEEAPKTEAEVLEGASVEELIGEDVDADGHTSVEGTADASGEQKAEPMQVEGEATCGIIEFQEVDKDSEEGLCDDCVVGVISSNKETIDEAVPSVNVGESEEVIENTSQGTIQGGLAKDGVSVGTIFVKLGSEPKSFDLVENHSCNHSSPTIVLESSDHVQTEESRSQEISVSVEQPVCSVSMEHGTMVVDEAAGNGCKEKSSNEPANVIIDELVVDDDEPNLVSSCKHARLDKPGCISKKGDSSEVVKDSRSLENGSPNEALHLTEPYENGNQPAKSSDVVETKCAEALAIEQDNGHHASGEWHGDHAQVIVPQKVYIIKVPKFAGDDIWNKIQVAQTRLDQLTQERDAINRRRQKQKAVCDQYREKLEAARQVEREARTAHGDKKNDLNSVRSVLGKLHQANSVEELDELIAKKERTLQHETIPLKEEKLLIKEINELKAQRKQLSATMGSKAEINEAFDQKDHIHERHKVLKKDSDVLFTNLKALEENTRKIQKNFEDERTALRKLTDEHRAANDLRQKAYIEWTELRNEPSKRNEYFFKYRDSRNAAETFRANGDTNGLISHCNSQIERVMEMWNQNEDFRKQYVESNKFSTLKRLGTHDGRRLGPDEDPPVIPSRRPSNIYPLSASSPEVPTLASTPAPVLAAPAAVPAKEDSFPVLAAPQTSKRAKSKASGSSAQIENHSVIVSDAEDLKQASKEKARLLEEQLELARKAEELARKEEELRQERDAAEKERLRMEQKAKAKEAEERKRRKAEKDKERAEFKARKEAEEREKKKAKKDKKKGTPPADSSAIGDSNAAALATADTDSNASDNPREVEVSQPAAPKRLSRPAAAIKQLNRLQPMPAPLRNRGRRKLRQYILIAAAVLSVLALFVAGNYIPRLKSVHS